MMMMGMRERKGSNLLQVRKENGMETKAMGGDGEEQKQEEGCGKIHTKREGAKDS